MSKLPLKLIATLCFGMGIATVLPVSADTDSEAKKSIEAALAKMGAAINKKDAIGYTQFYAEDMVLLRRNGQKMTKPQAVAATAQMCQQVKSIKLAHSIKKFTYSKDKAIVTVHENGVIMMPKMSGGADDKVSMASLDESTWVRTGSGWRIQRVKEIIQKVAVNGKPLGTTK